ncbi:glycoside hydrolase [Gramella lutea]|uniref:Glycoside hydrolase n=1 Tax=Christiangramia lutea TaxID=1607951 RepID=A0A9X2AAI9_9FLAO|nr:glycoside hydrolase [Christiangramia lutea]MCH4822133.1 glycoside hydrolase [Christiangramia lutea]
MFRFAKFQIPNHILVIIGILLHSCQAEIPSRKYNGISLVASRDSLEESQIDRILSVNANVVALMPYAFMGSPEQPELIFDVDRQWFGERAEGIEQAISILQYRKLKIMIKPHIWIRNGQFTGNLNFSSEKDWLIFEESYRKYMLLYANIAEKHQIEMFCIGTELFNFTNERPEFWKSLMRDVRKVFNGKIVYAENWDKVDKTEIWKETDYIGVDAYFPIHDAASPEKEEIREGWKEHKNMLQELSSKYHKPIIFTEYGYRNIDHSLKKPWKSDRNYSNINNDLQARALEIIYEEFWNENWFSGGFLWKWHQYEKAGGTENDRFTPQNKPAENIVKEYYQKFRN